MVIPGQSVEAATNADQCLYTVTGRDARNNFILGKHQCFGTYAEVLVAAGGQNVPKDITPASVGARAVLGTTSIIGTHYDGTGGSGASFSVSGTACNGGGLNVSLDWNDRISSTLNGCNSIVHYENTNYAGTTGVTYGAGLTVNLGVAMDNRTSSIKYFN